MTRAHRRTTAAVDAGGRCVDSDIALASPTNATNFKFTRWEDVAGPQGLEVDTISGDPRG